MDDLRRAQTARIGLVNGCFDLLHSGHIEFLEKAKALCDTLVVAVNSDESVKCLKGKDRPVMGIADRMSVLQALSCVDITLQFNGLDCANVLWSVKPLVWIKGSNYTLGNINSQEKEMADRLGIKIQFVHTESRSTTEILADWMKRAGFGYPRLPDAPPKV